MKKFRILINKNEYYQFTTYVLENSFENNKISFTEVGNETHFRYNGNHILTVVSESISKEVTITEENENINITIKPLVVNSFESNAQ